MDGQLPLCPPPAVSAFSLLKELSLCPLCADKCMKRDLHISAKALLLHWHQWNYKLKGHPNLSI